MNKKVRQIIGKNGFKIAGFTCAGAVVLWLAVTNCLKYDASQALQESISYQAHSLADMIASTSSPRLGLVDTKLADILVKNLSANSHSAAVWFTDEKNQVHSIAISGEMAAGELLSEFDGRKLTRLVEGMEALVGEVVPIYRGSIKVGEVGVYAYKNKNHHVILGSVLNQIGLYGWALFFLAVAGYTALLERRKRWTLAAKADQRLQTCDQQQVASLSSVNGMLHNLGNLINSVNMSIEELRRVAMSRHYEGLSRVCSMAKSVPELANRFGSGKDHEFYEYLKTLGEVLVEDGHTLNSEVDGLTKRIRLIKETLANRHQPGQFGVNCEVIAVEDVISLALQAQDYQVKRHQIAVKVDLQKSLFVSGNKTQLVNVFVNLIKNAGEAMAENNRHGRAKCLTIKAYRRGLWVCIDVIDNGPGISDEGTGRIFEIGYSNKHAGQGYGLHTVRTTLVAVGGEIAVKKNCEGTGSVFSVKLLPAQGLVNAQNARAA